MTHDPRQPLTPEEADLAVQLPRLHGRSEPDALLDARILAAARAAAAPATALRPRMRWIAPMALAASLSLAVGLAWRLQPPAAPDDAVPAAEAGAMDMRATGIATSPPAPVPDRPTISPPSPAPRQPPARDTAATVEMRPVAPAAPPPAPPAPPAVAPSAIAESAAVADMVAAPTAAPASSPAMAKASIATEGMRERAAARAGSGAAPRPQAQANEAAVAADAAVDVPQPFVVDDPGEDVPPATVDSPEVRDAWLRRIQELMREGRSAEADASLAEFRRRYPDTPLPPDLRKPEP